jgi:putative nucleotidyltransferase with HDIG domain
VSLYAARLAQAMGLDEVTVRVVEQGALLHDIGKIGVPDSVLLKPGPLTDDEWKVMKRHPGIGYDLLRSIDFLDGARDIIVQHQERFDGNGYPRALRGEDSSVGARIFACVDTYDAITSDRPYRKGRPYEVAREEIQRCAGTQLDPKVVEAFVSVPEGSWHDIRDQVREASEREVASREAA